MLYLVIDKKENCNLVKIGYAKDVAERKKAYHTCNPLARFIDEKSGTKEEEKKYHESLRSVCQFYIGEWYAVNDDTFESIVEEGFDAIDYGCIW